MENIKQKELNLSKEININKNIISFLSPFIALLLLFNVYIWAFSDELKSFTEEQLVSKKINDLEISLKDDSDKDIILSSIKNIRGIDFFDTKELKKVTIQLPKNYSLILPKYGSDFLQEKHSLLYFGTSNQKTVSKVILPGLKKDETVILKSLVETIDQVEPGFINRFFKTFFSFFSNEQRKNIPASLIILQIMILVLIIGLIFISLEFINIKNNFLLKEKTESFMFRDKFNQDIFLEKNLNGNTDFNYTPNYIELIKFLIGSLFILGLLGSFFGIGGAINSWNNQFTPENTQRIINSLRNVFGASVSGLSTALVLEFFLQILYKKIFLLESLVSELVLFILKQKVTETESNFKDLISKGKINTQEVLSKNLRIEDRNMILLSSFIVNSSKKISDKLESLEQNLNNKVEFLSNSISGAVEENKNNINNLIKNLYHINNKIIETFDTSLTSLLKDFNIKNENLISDMRSILLNLKNDNKEILSMISQKFSDIVKNQKDSLDLINKENNKLLQNFNSNNNKLLDSYKDLFDSVNIKLEKFILTLDDRDSKFLEDFSSIKLNIVKALDLFSNSIIRYQEPMSNFIDKIQSYSNNLEILFKKLEKRQKEFYKEVSENNKESMNLFINEYLINKMEEVFLKISEQNNKSFDSLNNSVSYLKDCSIDFNNNISNSISKYNEHISSIEKLNDLLDKSVSSSSNIPIEISKLKNELESFISNFTVKLQNFSDDIEKAKKINDSKLNEYDLQTKSISNTIDSLINKMDSLNNLNSKNISTLEKLNNNFESINNNINMSKDKINSNFINLSKTLENSDLKINHEITNFDNSFNSKIEKISLDIDNKINTLSSSIDKINNSSESIAINLSNLDKTINVQNSNIISINNLKDSFDSLIEESSILSKNIVDNKETLSNISNLLSKVDIEKNIYAKDSQSKIDLIKLEIDDVDNKISEEKEVLNNEENKF